MGKNDKLEITKKARLF